ncbi:MAG: hypothetical protein ACOY81_05420 [Bacillota bacterium]|uniref:hypothetical protein n=1 Tax=Desulfurispora thermophila TaxID=265470 RepID=UPI000363B4D9|nr:hypothetical protein [Desulfurispora thermophila]
MSGIGLAAVKATSSSPGRPVSQVLFSESMLVNHVIQALFTVNKKTAGFQQKNNWLSGCFKIN